MEDWTFALIGGGLGLLATVGMTWAAVFDKRIEWEDSDVVLSRRSKIWGALAGLGFLLIALAWKGPAGAVLPPHFMLPGMLLFLVALVGGIVSSILDGKEQRKARKKPR